MQTEQHRPPRENARLYEDIVQQFHALVQQGELQHGARLPSERAMAEQFQVSRSSVREALRSLELQGLVVSKRGSGTFVNTNDLDSMVSLLATTLGGGPGAPETLRDIFEMRWILEPQIAEMAALRANPEEMLKLSEILEEQGQQISNGDTGVDADTAFHFALASATHNAALVKLISAVADILRESRDQNFQAPGRPRRSLESHGQILDMVRSADPTGARKAMEHHLAVVEPAEINGSRSPVNGARSPVNGSLARSSERKTESQVTG